MRWADSLNTDWGGSGIADALVSTIALAHQGKCDILLVTDGGSESMNEDVDRTIDIVKRSNHRVFVVVIGAGPSMRQLQRLALASGGMCSCVARGKAAEPAVLSMFNRLRGVCIDAVRVEWPAEWVSQWEQVVPNVVVDEDVITVHAFFENAVPIPAGGLVKLWGRMPDSKDEQLLAKVAVIAPYSTTNILARMVGYAQYTQLMSVTPASVEFTSSAGDIATAYQLATEKSTFVLRLEKIEGDKTVYKLVPHAWKPKADIADHQGPRSVQYATAPHALSVALMGGYRCDELTALGNNEGFEPPHKVVDINNPNFWARRMPWGLSSNQAKEWERSHPAHLRLVSDIGLTPAGMVAWLKNGPSSSWPLKYLDLYQAGLSVAVCDWLEFVIGANRNEHQVMQAFMQVMVEFDFRRAIDFYRSIAPDASAFESAPVPLMGKVDQSVSAEIRTALYGLQAHQWPEHLLHFGEASGVV